MALTRSQNKKKEMMVQYDREDTKPVGYAWDSQNPNKL